MLITGPGDATVDATPARSHGYPRLLDMRRAVREQVQPAEPGDDHTSDATGYTRLPRSEDDRAAHALDGRGDLFDYRTHKALPCYRSKT